MQYQILEKDKNRYIGLVLLNEIIQFQHYFPTKASGEDIFIAHHLEALSTNKFIDEQRGKYIPTQLGRDELKKLYDKYYEYLKMFDIYSLVDLDKGEFAFSSMDNGMSDDEWNNFISNDRFSDVRVAVAEFKGMNPIEIVFMSFLNENRFDTTAPRWQYNLTGDSIWREIEDICNTAITLDYLKEGGVITNVITEGTKIAMNLIKLADESDSVSRETSEITEVTTTEETTEEFVDVVDFPYYGYGYFEPYYDPFYVSPLWLAVDLMMW